jgi:type II secretory pathway component PulF
MSKTGIRLEKIESIGYSTILAGVTLALFAFAITISILPKAMGEYLPPWPLTLQSYWVFIALSVSLILAHIPLSIRVRSIMTEMKKLNESVMILTDSLSVNLRTGMNFTGALRRSLQKITSPVLKRRLIIMLSLVESGERFDVALKRVTEGLPSYIIDILSVLIPASESGGKAGRVIMIASDFTRRIAAFDRSKRGSLSPYFYISLMAIAVFEGATLFLLYLIKNFQQISQAGMTGFIVSQMGLTQTWALVFYMNLLIVLLSSIFTSKVVRGKIKYYSDYFVIFASLHLIIMGIAPVYLIL